MHKVTTKVISKNFRIFFGEHAKIAKVPEKGKTALKSVLPFRAQLLAAWSRKKDLNVYRKKIVDA